MPRELTRCSARNLPRGKVRNSAPIGERYRVLEYVADKAIFQYKTPFYRRRTISRTPVFPCEDGVFCPKEDGMEQNYWRSL